MKRQYLLLGSLAIWMTIGSYAYADGVSQLYNQFQDLRADRAQVEAQLGIAPQKDTFPRATSYYDDKEDHYEQVLIMSDEIDKGIR